MHKLRPPAYVKLNKVVSLQVVSENRLGMTVAAIAILIMTIVVGVNSISLKQKEKKYAAREQELQEHPPFPFFSSVVFLVSFYAQLHSSST